MFNKFVFMAMSVAMSSALELTPDNWDEKTGGKTVFVKFFAPWCGHCKKMKPAWDSLMKEYESSETILVADVDCINAGKDLCQKNGVKGFPSVKFGNAVDLEDYKGARDLEALQEFVSSLGPQCNPSTYEHCSEEQTLEIKILRKTNKDELQKMVSVYDTEKESIQKTFKENVANLQSAYEQMVESKDLQQKLLDKTINIKMARMVLNSQETTGNTEL